MSTSTQKLRVATSAIVSNLIFFLCGYPKEIRSVHARWMSGMRARDWDIAAIQTGIDKRLGTGQEPYCRLMAYYHFHDSGQNEKAYRELSTATAYFSTRGRDSPMARLIEIELAYIMGILYIDLPKARTIIEMRHSTSTLNLFYLRALASVEIASGQGKPNETLDLLDAQIASHPTRNQANMQAERDWARNLRQRANRALDA